MISKYKAKYYGQIMSLFLELMTNFRARNEKMKDKKDDLWGTKGGFSLLFIYFEAEFELP